MAARESPPNHDLSVGRRNPLPTRLGLVQIEVKLG